MGISEAPGAVFIFIVTIGLSLYTLFQDRRLLYELILSPFEVVHYNRWYTLITSAFIHGDIMHLAFNMFTFYFFAFPLEQIFGTPFFLSIYFFSMVIGDVPSVIKHKDNPDYKSLGASGAISGVVFSFILFFPTVKMSLMLLPIGIPAFIFGPLYLLYTYFAGKRSYDNVNHDAHLWGALAGAVLTIILKPQVIESFLSAVFG